MNPEKDTFAPKAIFSMVVGAVSGFETLKIYVITMI
jgi:hypothetical protein